MLELASSADLARATGRAADAARLLAEYRAHSSALGGDDPAAWRRSVDPAAWRRSGVHTTSSSGASASLGAPPPSCVGSPAPSTHVGGIGPVNDVTSQVFTCVVAGAGPVLWDIAAYLDLEHTYAADLDIVLTSPLGTSVTLTTDNGGSADNVFAGTLFTDAVNNARVTDATFVNGQVLAALSPEGRLTAFRGQNPNGTWTLTVTDDASGDFGLLREFRLELGAVAAPPATSTLVVSKLSNDPLFDNGTRLDNQTVAGAGPILVGLSVRVDISHTFPADIDLRLRSPAGTVVTLSTDNGGPFDDVFLGSTFNVTGATPISDYAYANLVVATPIGPEGPFLPLYGEDPNGVWQIQVTDDSFGDLGVLHRWDLTITTCSGCSSSVTSYCTTSTTSSGCNPAMAASSSAASISGGPGSFVLQCSQVEGQKFGLFFYGISGSVAFPWWPGSTSTLCVKSPTQRMRQISTGGTAGACDGSGAEDFFDFIFNFNPGSLGNPPTVGQQYNAQLWFRDPPATKTTNLSDALEFVLCP